MSNQIFSSDFLNVITCGDGSIAAAALVSWTFNRLVKSKSFRGHA